MYLRETFTAPTPSPRVPVANMGAVFSGLHTHSLPWALAPLPRVHTSSGGAGGPGTDLAASYQAEHARH